MAALEIPGNGESGNHISEECIQKAVNALEDPLQKASLNEAPFMWPSIDGTHCVLQDFILKCLERDPAKRMKARELLFHPVLFEVHSLRLLAAHSLVQHSGGSVR